MQRYLIIQIIAALAGAYMAGRKLRSISAWAIACFLFPPVLLILSALPRVITSADISRCPKCNSAVLRGSQSCPRCGDAMPIDMVECGACGKFVPEGGRCPECGAPLAR